MSYIIRKNNVRKIGRRIFFLVILLNYGYEKEWMFVIDFYHLVFEGVNECK